MKKMKKILLLTIPALCLLLGSCEDLLRSQSHTETGPENYITNASEAEIVLHGCYSDLGSDAMYGYFLSVLYNISTDIAQCEGDGINSFRAIPTNTHNANTSEISDTWEALYKAIYNANSFIEIVSERKGNWSYADQKLAEIQIAEARALRGLYHFELLRWYGNITVMLSTEESLLPPAQYLQIEKADVYKVIEADLRHAAETLPWATDDKIRNNSAFRFSKGAAYGLLAKVYATWAGYPVLDESKWTEAALAANMVISANEHSLLPDYETVWKNTCNGIWDPKESLLEVSFFSPTGIESSDHVGRIGKWNGVVTSAIAGVRGRNSANVKVSGYFSSEWLKLKDPRYDLSVAEYRYGATFVDANDVVIKDVPGYITYEEILKTKNPLISPEKLKEGLLKDRSRNFNPAKWDTEKYVESANKLLNNDKSNVNWYILRYSDVLLIYAEALIESGGSVADAAEVVNIVRRRGFGDSNHDISTALSHEDMRAVIRQERAYELCFEGHRRHDLIRWGIYHETIIQTASDIINWYGDGIYPAARYTVKGKHELFPIPQRDLDMLSSYKQNPGW